jgi:Ca2+-binding EF-hand superfamily protein
MESVKEKVTLTEIIPMESELEREIKKQYDIFADEDTNRVIVGDLPYVFSALKRNYSPSYIKALLTEEGFEEKRDVGMDEFVKIFRLTKEDQKNAAMLEKAFKAFDEDKDGKISVSDFKALMSASFGDGQQSIFDAATQEKIVASFEKEDGLIDIKKLAEKVTYTITIAKEQRDEEKVTESEDVKSEPQKVTEREEANNQIVEEEEEETGTDDEEEETDTDDEEEDL